MSWICNTYGSYLYIYTVSRCLIVQRISYVQSGRPRQIPAAPWPSPSSKLPLTPHLLPHKIHVGDSRDLVQFPRLIPRIRGYRHDGPKVQRVPRSGLSLPAILPSQRRRLVASILPHALFVNNPRYSHLLTATERLEPFQNRECAIGPSSVRSVPLQPGTTSVIGRSIDVAPAQPNDLSDLLHRSYCGCHTLLLCIHSLVTVSFESTNKLPLRRAPAQATTTVRGLPVVILHAHQGSALCMGLNP